jgi:hypothetical protein
MCKFEPLHLWIGWQFGTCAGIFPIFVSIRETNSHRRKIRLIEGNAKCRHLKKLTCFAAGVYLSDAQNPISPPPPLNSVQYTCIQYTCSHRGGGGEPEED